MADHLENENTTQVLSVFIGEQIFGIPILKVEDVLTPLELTKVPLASNYIAGVSNLRGRIVTAISLRKRIKEPDETPQKSMNVVIENKGELYSILVDRVGDVLLLDNDKTEDLPSTAKTILMDICEGVHQLDETIILILNPESVVLDCNTKKGSDHEIVSYC